MAGRRGAAARGQGRAARAHPGEPPRVLRAGGRRPGSSRRCSRPAAWPATASWASGTPSRWRRCRGRRPGRENFVPDVQAMRRRVEEQRPQPRGRPAAQARARRAARRRVQRAAAPARARPHRGAAAHRQHPRGGRAARRRTASSAATTRRPSTAPTATCACSSTGIQLTRLRRTHLMPTTARPTSSGSPAPRGYDGVAGLERRLRDTRTLVRVAARAALLPAGDGGRRAAERRGDAADHAGGGRTGWRRSGYRDPSGAMRHLEALTEGVSRRAAIQRQLLPVLLGWFAEGADPDAGLLAFRRVSDALGTTHWYLKLLRDSGAAAERMARVVSSGPVRGRPAVAHARGRPAGSATTPRSPRAAATSSTPRSPPPSSGTSSAAAAARRVRAVRTPRGAAVRRGRPGRPGVDSTRSDAG